MLLARAFIGLTGLLLSFISSAHHIEVHQGHIRETIPGTQVSAAYMTLTNSSNTEVALNKVTADFSKRIEIHQHTMVDGMMRMGKVESLAVPAHGQTQLKPSGYHLMIFDLANPLRAGSEKTLTLYFNDGSVFDVRLGIESLKAQGRNPNANQHNH
jgi:copper(I)-binding protein